MFLNIFLKSVLFSGIAISDELDKVRFTVRLMNSTKRQMIVIILGNKSCISLSWHTHFSSIGFRESLGMESYIGEYSIC